MRDLGFDEVVGWSFTDPGEAGPAADPGRRPARRRRSRVSNPLSEDQSVMRTTLLGSLLDAARYNLARGAERVALFESGRVYLPRGRVVRRTASAGRRLRRRAAGAVLRAAPDRLPRGRRRWRRVLARRRRCRPTSSRSRACSRRSPASSAPSSSFEPGERAVPAPGPRGAGPGRRRRRRLDRRAPPAGLPRVGPRRRRPPSRSTSRRCVAAVAGRRGDLRGRDDLSRPSTRTWRSSCDEDVPAADGARGGARRRRRAAALGRGLRPLPRASRSARGARAWRCGSSSAPPTARSPTRRSPSAARRDRGGAGGDRGVAP